MTTLLEREIDELLQRSSAGDAQATHALFTKLGKELRAIAGFLMSSQPRGHTLQPTVLVSEAYLRFIRTNAARIQTKAHFMGVAARAMRWALIDHTRQRRAARKSEAVYASEVRDVNVVAFDQMLETFQERAIDLEALDAALDRLAERDERMARAVELRFFAGLSVEETAEILGMSKRAFEREWTLTRRWLREEIG
jgi:RNA polymerase sigma factor (TIGR02999 family)